MNKKPARLWSNLEYMGNVTLILDPNPGEAAIRLRGKISALYEVFPPPSGSPASQLPLTGLCGFVLGKSFLNKAHNIPHHQVFTAWEVWPRSMESKSNSTQGYILLFIFFFFFKWDSGDGFVGQVLTDKNEDLN